MLITSPDAVIQALANIKLESLTLSEEVQALLQRALSGEKIDTVDILNILHEQ
ncbi:MAG: hypothetical protein ACI8WB_004767 [Phenylobacterium sp.]|jgi:hypothetical protein